MGYLGGTVLALFFPKAAAVAYLVTAAISIIRARGDEPPEENEAEEELAA